MRLVTINTKLFSEYRKDIQFLQKSKRPCVLIIRLKYRGHNHDFAVPLRSNIPAASPKDEYFPLPTRPNTRDGNRHGVHYIKMFPVKKNFLLKYNIDHSISAKLSKAILDKNEKQIIRECQDYLNRYENGQKPAYSTDLDFLLEQMEKL